MEIETSYIKMKVPHKVKMKVPHERGELSFQHPAFKGTYGNVAEQIDKAGLKRPNSPETASLVYDAWQNPQEKYSPKIIKILKNARFWEFTGNLYLPKSNEEINNGVIFEYNPKITNGKLTMNKNDLIKRLESNDTLVKFVPFGTYKTGEQTIKELKKNKYIVARYGEEGAEKIAKVADKYQDEPFLLSFNSVNEEKVRMSVLYRFWGFVGGLLVIGGDLSDGCRGHAFGACKE